MHFSRDGAWYQVIRITGPAHNLLALKFNEPNALKLTIEALSISDEAPSVCASDVETQVLMGIVDANKQLGTRHRVSAIRFVTTDTPSPNAYRHLATCIVKRLAQKDQFAA